MNRRPLIVMFFLLLLLSLSACNLPGAATKPVVTNTAKAPIIPSNTPVPPTPVPPTETPTPTEVPPRYAGMWVQEGETFHAYNFVGGFLGKEINVVGVAPYLSEQQFQVVGDTAYYYSPDTQQVMRATVGGGAPVALGFIPNSYSTYFAISLDGSKISWAEDTYAGTAPSSRLMIANIDGSNSQQIASISEVGNDRWLVLAPVRWTDDGQLIYATNITGIGGYILFGGHNQFLRYNPADGSIVVLSNDTFGICLNDVSPDQSMVSAGCGENVTDGVQIIHVGSMAATVLPVLPDQTQAGSALFSQDGQRVAYAVARGEYDHEYGQVAVAPVDGSAAPLVVTAYGPGYYHVAGWINDQTLLLERYDFSGGGDSTSLWIVNLDGSGLAQVASGSFRGFILNP